MMVLMNWGGEFSNPLQQVDHPLVYAWQHQLCISVDVLGGLQGRC